MDDSQVMQLRPVFIEIHAPHPHAAAARLMRLRHENWSGTPDTGQVFLENDEILKNVWYVKFLLHKFGSFTTFN